MRSSKMLPITTFFSFFFLFQLRGDDWFSLYNHLLLFMFLPSSFIPLPSNSPPFPPSSSLSPCPPILGIIFAFLPVIFFLLFANFSVAANSRLLYCLNSTKGHIPTFPAVSSGPQPVLRSLPSFLPSFSDCVSLWSIESCFWSSFRATSE